MFNNNEKKRIKIAKGLKYGKEKINEYENEEYLYTRGFGNFQYKSNNFHQFLCSLIYLITMFLLHLNQF